MRLIQLFKAGGKSAFSRYQKLSLLGKALIWFILFFYASLTLFIVLVTPGRIAQYLHDRAQDIQRLRYGAIILVLVIILISFPPFIGHTTMVNLCGFTYGLRGFIPAAIGTVVGSAIVFVILRLLFSKRLRTWSSTNEKWQALETVVRAKGLPLIILIRVSSFPPWVYSNSLFASIESVSLIQFVIATLFVLPKVFLFCFVGSRLSKLSDGEQRSHMDTQTKVINSLLALGGVLLAVAASSVVYFQMQKQIMALRSSPSQQDELAAEALEGAEEGAPLLRTLSSDSIDNS
ncbi:Golgi apparatus membrane protein TVP38 [Hygrophoropsis aurantiaca]|uniref:Golgi apparatus membrane protein TVP38 n=1 Tax=Hygrophoropsis aurantiaca TaxID=72124 RepID=A0ACB8ATC1_9AGAM|nr:Golgi apparatus membrane protein TVP38 [Hygrophoropsis aurantiaca]